MKFTELFKPLYHGSNRCTMFILTDEMIDIAIDSEAGFIIAKVAEETERTLDDIANLFYSSNLYALLSDKNTGYYWDSIPDMIEQFYTEMPSLAEARKVL